MEDQIKRLRERIRMFLPKDIAERFDKMPDTDLETIFVTIAPLFMSEKFGNPRYSANKIIDMLKDDIVYFQHAKHNCTTPIGKNAADAAQGLLNAMIKNVELLKNGI